MKMRYCHLAFVLIAIMFSTVTLAQTITISGNIKNNATSDVYYVGDEWLVMIAINQYVNLMNI